jgi:hypothetical protein
VKRSNVHLAATLAVVVASLGIFVWAVYKTFAIGIHASDTETSGDTDQIVWVWLFASFAVLVVATVDLIVMVRRRSGTQRPALDPGKSSGGGAEHGKTVPL